MPDPVRTLPLRARVCVLAMALVSMAAVPAATEEGAAQSGAWDMERAFVEMERLRAEIRMLRGLSAAQAALLAWNRERAETLGPDGGVGPAALAPGLCAEAALEPWCRALPATFGAAGADAADGGAAEERQP